MSWHEVYKDKVKIENNLIIDAMKRDKFGDYHKAYVYHWNGRQWVNVTGKCTLNMLYAGLKRDTYTII